MSQDVGGRLVAGRWTLHTPLRRARRGVVWRASEPGGRQLAVEELRLPARPDPGERGQADLWDRVAAEARTAAALDHPGLLRLDDVVVEDGVVYVATELLDALTLDELIARHGPLPVRRVAQLGLELLDALEAAHAAGLAHLDLRPACVLVTADGRARLAGIGLTTLRTAQGGEHSSTAFRAPEQVRGDAAGPAADLWSLGTILFLAVEGEAPFPGDGTEITRTAIPTQPPMPPELAGPLAPALHALLTKPPGGRPTIPQARRLLEPLAGSTRPAGVGVGAGQDSGPPASDTLGYPHGWGLGGGYGSRAARNAMDPLVRRVLLIAGGSVVLALVSFAVAVAVTGDPLGLRSQAVASTVATVPPTTAAPTTTAPTTTVTTQPALVPPGWAVHTDPATGYQVAIPPGWQVVSDGGPRTELRDQSSPTFLRIDWVQDPQADPVTLEQQADQAHAGERGGYQRARLEPAQFKGLPAAVLEFTYQDGETWHALELGVRSPRHHIAMAIYARDRDWGSGWALFEAFKGSFVPPAG
jgi:eukaryotic-like serine/threonine-protein kinase